MNIREFLKTGLGGIIAGSIILINGCGIKNPTAPLTSDDRYGKLFIKTEKDIYVWQSGFGESFKTIHIHSKVENISTNVYYSKVGDFY